MKKQILLATILLSSIYLSGCGIADKSSAISTLKTDLGYEVTCIEENYEYDNFGNYLLEDNSGIRFSYISQRTSDGTAYTIDNYQSRYMAEKISDITKILNENNLEYEAITSNDYFKNTELDEIIIHSNNLKKITKALIEILNNNKYPIDKNTNNSSIVPVIYLEDLNTKIEFLYDKDSNIDEDYILEQIEGAKLPIEKITICGFDTVATAYFDEEYGIQINLNKNSTKNDFNISTIFTAKNIKYNISENTITYEIGADNYKIYFNEAYKYTLFYKNNNLEYKTDLIFKNGNKFTVLSISQIEDLFGLTAKISDTQIDFK